jgi:hypothetical protein
MSRVCSATNLFQPAVLVLELLQALHPAESHAAELGLRAVYLSSVMPCVRHRSATLRPASPSRTNLQNLFVAEFAPLPWGLLGTEAPSCYP